MKNLPRNLAILFLGTTISIWSYTFAQPKTIKQSMTFGAPTGAFYYANLLRFSTTTTGCLNGKTTDTGVVTTYFTGTNCGTGASGSVVGTVSTSTSPTIGNLAYWTSKDAWPETLGSVATTSLTATSPLALSQAISVIGAAASALSIDTSGAWTGTAGALAANGANCNAGNAPLGVDASGAVESCFDVWTEAENTAAAYVPGTRTITVAGTANQITSSAGAQDLSANRTWTLSFPTNVIFPNSISSHSASSTLANFSSTTIGYLNLGLLSATSTATSTFVGGVASANASISDLLTVNRICFSTGECMSAPNVTGSNVTLFNNNTASDIGGYESLTTFPPSTGAAVDESCSADADVTGGYCNIDSYATAVSDIEFTSIPAGVWEFRRYAYVDSTAGNSKLEATVYRRTSGGTEIPMFQATSSDINSTSIVLQEFSSAQAAFTFDSTDRLVTKVRAWTDQSAAKVIHFVYNSSQFYSRIITPATIDSQGFTKYFHNEAITGLWSFGNVGTTTFSGGLYGSLLSAPYFHATSTTASTTLQNVKATNIQATSLSTAALGLTCTGCITNGNLANSTISGIALGSNLAALTNDATLNGSSYNGSTAISDWGINLGNANTWTALQKFSYTGTTTISSGLEAGTGIGAPWFVATSTTATSTMPNLLTTDFQGGDISLSGGLYSPTAIFGASNSIILTNSRANFQTGGTLASPAITIGGSSVSLYNPTTNVFGLGVNGVERLQLTNATSTFAGGLETGTAFGAPYLFATSTTATSTFSGGVNLAGGGIKNGAQVVYPFGFGGLPYASSTLAYIGAYSATGTTTIRQGNFPVPVELTAVYCKTDIGTAYMVIGDGTATSTAIKCDADGESGAASVDFAARDDFWIGIGTNASAPNIITVSPTIRTE